MHANEQLIHNFYSAFLDKDYQTMQNSYAEEATFSDPVFQHLSVQEVRAMWEMFCKRGKDMQLTFSNMCMPPGFRIIHFLQPADRLPIISLLNLPL